MSAYNNHRRNLRIFSNDREIDELLLKAREELDAGLHDREQLREQKILHK